MLRASSLRALAALVLPLALLGCGDDDEEANTDYKTALRGIYSIDSSTQNDASCDEEGPAAPVPGGYTKLAIKGDSFGVYFVIAIPCNDAEDCASRAGASIFAGLAGGAVLPEGSDAEGWTGESIITSTAGTECEGTVATYLLTTPRAKEVRMETRTTSVTFPAGSSKDDPCPTDKAKSEAAGQPCSLGVLTGTYEQELANPPES